MKPGQTVRLIDRIAINGSRLGTVLNVSASGQMIYVKRVRKDPVWSATQLWEPVKDGRR